MGRVTIAALSAVVTTIGVVVVGGFILWLAAPSAVDDPRATADLSQLMAIQSSTPQQPVAAPQGSPPVATVATTPPTASTAAPSQAQVTSAGLADGVQVFPLTHHFFAAAYDEESGHLLVAARKENQVDLYDTTASAQLIISTNAPTNPTVVAVKKVGGKPLFVVGGEAEPRVDVIDGVTGANMRSLPTSGKKLETLTGDVRADSPIVYVGMRDPENNVLTAKRMNLQTLADEPGPPIEGDSIIDSRDGTSRYIRNPNGYFCELLEGGQASEYVQRNNRSTSANTFLSDQYSAYVLADRKVMSGDLRSELGAMLFDPSAFVPGTPWVVGVKANALCIGSLNDFQTVATVPLPDEFFQSRDTIEDPRPVRRTRRTPVQPSDPSPQDYRLFMDAKRERVLVVSGNQLAVVPLAAFKLPHEASLALQLATDLNAEVYKPLEATVRKVDPSVNVKALVLPAGMTFDGEHLEWKSAGNQPGEQTITLEASNGKARREYKLFVQVTRPSVALPFSAQQVALSQDGSRAVVWGFGKSVRDSSGIERLGPAQIAVVDIGSRKVLATRSLPRAVESAAINENGVYVVLQNTEQGFPGEVHRLKLEDLSIEKTASTEKPLENNGAALVLVGNSVLVFGSDKFSLPDLTRLPNDFVRNEPRFESLEKPRFPTADLGDTIYSSGMVWDREMSKIQILIDPPCFAIAPAREYDPDYLVTRARTKWGRYLWPGMFEGPQGGNLVERNYRGGGPVFLPQLPAAAFFSRESSPMPQVVFRELVKGEETQTIDLQSSPNMRDLGGRDALFASAGNVIVACMSGPLDIVSLDEVDATKFKPPFRVAQTQAMVMPNEPKPTLRYELLDGEPPYQLRMTIGKAKFTSSNQQEGTIEIDTTQFIDEVQQAVRNGIQSIAGSQDDKAAERVFDYVEYVTPLFEKITGRKPSGVPCAVPVRVEVTDKNLNVARMSHAYLMELPQVKIVKDVDMVLAANRRPREPGTDRRTARRDVPPRERPEKPEKAAKATNNIRREEREKLLRELAADYSSVLLKRNPPEKVLDEEVEAAAKVARDEADKQFVEILDKHKAATKGGMRKWSDNAGHVTTAALSDVFAEQVVLTRQSGGQVTVPIEKLSVADQEFIKSAQEAGAGVRPEEYVPAQMELLMRGISGHSHQMQVYPPAFLKGKDGTPQLSWRVLILPYIGGQKLFELFKLDEPWDSEHNRKLLKFRPGVYSTLDEEVSATHTTMLSLRGRGSLMADSTPVSPNDVSDALDSIMVLAEMKEDKAVEWTRPDDFEDAMFEQIFQCVEQRDGKTYVSTANGAVRSLSSDTLAEELRKAVNIADDAEGDIKFDDAITAAAGAKPSLASTRPRSKAIRSNDRLDHSLEEIPNGKFVLSAEKPDAKLLGSEETRGGLKIRALPFRDSGSPGSADCVVSPDGMIYGVTGMSLVRIDPAKGRVEAQATMRQPIQAIHWCFGKLLLVGNLGSYIEYQNERGSWRRLEDKAKVSNPNALARRTEGMQVWIVDPSTLKTLRGFVVAGDYLSCAPNSARVLAMHGNDISNRIDLVDLKRGEQAATLPKRSDKGDDDNENQPDGVRFNDVAIMPDGESAVAMSESRFSRIDFSENGLMVRTGAGQFYAEGQSSWPHMFASADKQFVAVLTSNTSRVLPEGNGFLVFKTPDFAAPYGGVPTRDREGVVGFDTERQTVYIAKNDGTLRVLRGKNEERFEGLPPGCKRIVTVPKRDAVLFLGESSFMASIPGKSDTWAFEPLPKNLVFEKSSMRGIVPASPRAFAKKEGQEWLSLADTNYAEAGISADGSTLYLLDNQGSGTLSAFDTQTWQERQRLGGDDNTMVATLRMTAQGPLVFGANETFHLLDPKTLSGVRAFKLPEIKSFVTSPGSNMLAAVTNFGDLRLLDAQSGKLVTEIPPEKVQEWDADDQSSDKPPATSLAMSADGKVLSLRTTRIHFLHVNENGLEHYLRSGPVLNNGTGAMLSPSGKYAGYSSATGELRAFELPNVGNAVGDMKVSLMAVDDRGWQYGPQLEQSHMAVFKPDGNAAYPSKPDVPVIPTPEFVLVDGAHPGRMVVRANGVWMVMDLKE